jgi:hypothetical protein
MNRTIGSAIVAILAASAVPLAASADTDVFSGKSAYAYISGNGTTSAGYAYISVSVFQSASKNNAGSSSGADVYETVYGENTCYEGYGSTVDNIQVNASANRKTLTASGTIPVIEFYDCYTYEPVNFSDNVLFTMNLTAITDQGSASRGTSHYEYGKTYKTNYRYDYTWRPASPDASTITSDFGAITPYWAELGQSKDHTVQIIK